MITYLKMKRNEWTVKAYFYAMILKFIDEQKDIIASLENLSSILKDSPTSNESNFNQIQKGIENNTDALQELRNALTAYQTTLKATGNAEDSGLNKIKKIILAMDTLESITIKFKNVGRGKMFPLIHCYCFENADYNMCSLGY